MSEDNPVHHESDLGGGGKTNINDQQQPRRRVTTDPRVQSFVNKFNEYSQVPTPNNQSNHSVSFGPSNDSEWHEDSSCDGDNAKPRGVGVMDVRHQQHVGPTGTSVKMDDEVASGLFRVAHGSDSSGDNYRLSGAGGDVGDHWRGDLVNAWRNSATITAEQSCRTIHMGHDDDDDDEDDEDSDDFLPGMDDEDDDYTIGACSVVSSGTSGSSMLWDRMESNKRRMDAKLKANTKFNQQTYGKNRKNDRKKKRHLFLRRCARAMVGVVALAGLGMSAIYLISEDNFDLILGIFFGSLFSVDNDSSRVTQGRKEDENHHHHLIYRKLPQGADGEEEDAAAAIPAPWLPPGGEYHGDRFYDEYGNEISPQEHHHRLKTIERRRAWEEINRKAREERIRAREERINNGLVGHHHFDNRPTMNYDNDNNNAEREYFYNNENNQVLSSRQEHYPHAREERMFDQERRNQEEIEARQLRVGQVTPERDNRRLARDVSSNKGRSSDTKYVRGRSRKARVNNN
mmetsp:Transcript_13962/g.29873  ORF Transcript_13962/g.29873 Transcript_13962/m.29873 type:complete len:514 (-) Transcript_13962:27-1568(-)